jgi:hypothetical protein
MWHQFLMHKILRIWTLSLVFRFNVTIPRHVGFCYLSSVSVGYIIPFNCIHLTYFKSLFHVNASMNHLPWASGSIHLSLGQLCLSIAHILKIYNALHEELQPQCLLSGLSQQWEETYFIVVPKLLLFLPSLPLDEVPLWLHIILCRTLTQ